MSEKELQARIAELEKRLARIHDLAELIEHESWLTALNEQRIMIILADSAPAGPGAPGLDPVTD